MILKVHLLRFGAILILPALLAACATNSDRTLGSEATIQKEAAAPAPKSAPPPKPTSAPMPAAVPPKAAPVFAPTFVGDGAAAGGTSIAAFPAVGACTDTRHARPPLARRSATKSRSPESQFEPPAVPEDARPDVLAATASPSELSSSATGAAPLQRMAASAFHIPNPITLDQSVVAQLRIDPGKDIETVRAVLGAATAGVAWAKKRNSGN